MLLLLLLVVVVDVLMLLMVPAHKQNRKVRFPTSG